MRTRRQGVSLAELLIALALFGLIATMIAALVRTAFTYMRQAEDRAELQRTSLFLLSNLSQEIAESSADSIRYADPGNDEPPGLVFGTPRGQDNQVEYLNNNLVWKKWVAVWWDEEAKLVLRVEEPLASPTTFKPDPMPVGFDKSVSGLAATSGLPRWVLARNVTGFAVEGGLEVRMSLQVEVNQGERRSRLTTRTGVRPNH